jgi:hypothetical protein
MQRSISLAGIAIAIFITGCGAPPGQTNVNVASTNANTGSNSNVLNTSNTAANSTSTTDTTVETKEPESYQATVGIRLEAIGGQQAVTLPTLSATVARSGNDRRMEFAIPAGGRVVYLDRGGTNYLIMPDKKQYAEINRDSTGFEVRRMLMPEQIVNQVRQLQGVERVGEEKYNGRDVIRYRYGAVANTQTQAGNVQTESFVLVDKETSLPLRSETTSQASGNVQGYNGVRIITEMSDVKTETSPDLFEPPTAFQKVQPEQVRAQVDLIFNALATFVGQMMKQAQTAATPAASPAR